MSDKIIGSVPNNTLGEPTALFSGQISDSIPTSKSSDLAKDIGAVLNGFFK